MVSAFGGFADPETLGLGSSCLWFHSLESDSTHGGEGELLIYTVGRLWGLRPALEPWLFCVTLGKSLHLSDLKYQPPSVYQAWLTEGVYSIIHLCHALLAAGTPGCTSGTLGGGEVLVLQLCLRHSAQCRQ